MQALDNLPNICSHEEQYGENHGCASPHPLGVEESGLSQTLAALNVRHTLPPPDVVAPTILPTKLSPSLLKMRY